MEKKKGDRHPPKKMVFYFIYKIVCLVFLSPSRHTYKYVPASVIRPATSLLLFDISLSSK